MDLDQPDGSTFHAVTATRLSRRTKDDARAYAVKLTEEGWRILKAADPLAKRVDDKILAALPGQQRERFLQDLALIVEALGKLESETSKS